MVSPGAEFCRREKGDGGVIVPTTANVAATRERMPKLLKSYILCFKVFDRITIISSIRSS
jgi:hypothetical protein